MTTATATAQLYTVDVTRNGFAALADWTDGPMTIAEITEMYNHVLPTTDNFLHLHITDEGTADMVAEAVYEDEDSNKHYERFYLVPVPARHWITSRRYTAARGWDGISITIDEADGDMNGEQLRDYVVERYEFVPRGYGHNTVTCWDGETDGIEIEWDEDTATVIWPNGDEHYYICTTD